MIVPTQRPRHMITETPEVEKWLNEAAEMWPAERESRGKLLLRLLEEGYHAVHRRREAAAAEWRETVESTSGALSGVYGKNYLAELREDWPE
jgi:hypothetical protein